jgi:hypothetical protein
MPFFSKARRQWRALGGGNDTLHTRDGSFFTTSDGVWEKKERNNDITQGKNAHIYGLRFSSSARFP